MKWRVWWSVLTGVVLFLVGVVSSLLGLSILEEGLRFGSLSPMGWLVAVSGILIFALLFLRVVMDVTRERREYQRVIRTLDLARAPSEFIASVQDAAAEFRTLVEKGAEGEEVTAESLEVVTAFLHEQGSDIRERPELIALAAAYVGEVLTHTLGGRWVVWRRGPYQDAAVKVGKGLSGGFVSPGMVVLRVADEPLATLEDVVAHGKSELSVELE